jgi:hypothetical protein
MDVVDTVLGDMADSEGDAREAVEAEGAEMVVKAPTMTNVGRFPRPDFTIDTGAGMVGCPAGNATCDARKVNDHKGRRVTVYRFDAATCATCPPSTEDVPHEN